MVVKLVVLFMLTLNTVVASEIKDAFQKKDYDHICELYQATENQSYSRQELVLISYALRKKGFFRQDIKLSSRIINKEYKALHKKVLAAMKNGETVDPDEYPEALKVLYWDMFNDYGQILLGYHSESELIKRDHDHFLVFSKILAELEFREGKVDKQNDKILGHIQHLKNKVYHFTKSFNLSYVSWQNQAHIDGNGKVTPLIVTNKGFCLGGDVGIENYLWHFYVDGCLLTGSGGVSAPSGTGITYQQTNVPAYGLKAGPGASMIVSSSKSRLGIKLPLIYSSQHLTDPAASTGYHIVKETPVSMIATVYSRWQFGDWYFQTEFGKYVTKEQTFWGLGFGKAF